MLGIMPSVWERPIRKRRGENRCEVRNGRTEADGRREIGQNEKLIQRSREIRKLNAISFKLRLQVRNDFLLQSSSPGL